MAVYTPTNWQVILCPVVESRELFLFVTFIQIPDAIRHDERTVSKRIITVDTLADKFCDGNKVNFKFVWPYFTDTIMKTAN